VKIFSVNAHEIKRPYEIRAAADRGQHESLPFINDGKTIRISQRTATLH
jgi:hypothetical protein